MTARMLHVELAGVTIVDPERSSQRDNYAQAIYERRQRKGVRYNEAHELAALPDWYGTIMVELGDADSLITGLGASFPESLRVPLQVIRTNNERRVAAGIYLVTTRNRVLFVGDVAVNIDPDAETLAEVALLTARLARSFDIEPRVAMLSFSNFGSVRHPRTKLVQQATEIVRKREPSLAVDGEMQATVALDAHLLNTYFPFNRLREEANVLVFPSLEAGNIAYKMVQSLANAEVVGPILVGMNRPIHVLQRNDEVKDIVNLAAIAVVEAQKH